MVHSGVTGGQLGLRSTMAGVALRAYWAGWTSDVKNELRRCDPCAQFHRGTAPKTTSLKPFLAGEPWETISIDITGPHPRSLKGYVYMLTCMITSPNGLRLCHYVIIQHRSSPQLYSPMF